MKNEDRIKALESLIERNELDYEAAEGNQECRMFWLGKKAGFEIAIEILKRK